MIVLKNARVFDGVDMHTTPEDIILDGHVVREIVPAREIAYERAETVWDLEGRTLAPGFIDCHMHMALDEIPDRDKHLTYHNAGGALMQHANVCTALIAAANAAKLLNIGFTTCVDGGAPYHIDTALKEALQVGLLPGPNYYSCVNHIVCSESHFPGLGTVACGEDGVRQAVRNMILWNADYIKVQMSPPARMAERDPNVMEFTNRELLAIVDEAHRSGLRVYAHLRGAYAIKQSIDCGIDVVIHGTNIDDEGIERMLKKGMYLLPTLDSPPEHPSERMRQLKSPATIAVTEESGRKHRECVRRAYKAGVKIGFSTDAGAVGVINGENAQEFFRLRDIGMSNIECLRCATSEAAKAIGQAHKLGKIAPGLRADLVVLPQNPLEHLEAVQNISAIIQNGRIVKSL